MSVKDPGLVFKKVQFISLKRYYLELFQAVSKFKNIFIVLSCLRIMP